MSNGFAAKTAQKPGAGGLTVISAVNGRVSKVFNHAGRNLLEGSSSVSGLHDGQMPMIEEQRLPW